MDKTCDVCGGKAKKELSLRVIYKRHFLDISLLNYRCVCNECVERIQKALGGAIENVIHDIRGECRYIDRAEIERAERG